MYVCNVCMTCTDVEWVDRVDYSVDPGRAASFYPAIRSFWPGALRIHTCIQCLCRQGRSLTCVLVALHGFVFVTVSTAVRLGWGQIPPVSSSH
jgi:hypothetical protein